MKVILSCNPFHLTAQDSDADDIPNEWEDSNFMDQHNSADATLDFDRDGLPANREYELQQVDVGEGPLGHWKSEIVNLDFMNRSGFAMNRKDIIDFNDRGDILVNARSWSPVLGGGPPTIVSRVWFFDSTAHAWREVAKVAGHEPITLLAHDLNNEGWIVGQARATAVNGGAVFGFMKNMRARTVDQGVLPWFTPEGAAVRDLTGINDYREVIGVDAAGVAYFYSPSTGTATCPPSWVAPVFTAINNLGQVAGYEYSGYWGVHAPQHFLMSAGWHWNAGFPAFDMRLLELDADAMLDPENPESENSDLTFYFNASFRPTWLNDWGEFAGNYLIEFEAENQGWSGSWFFDGYEYDATLSGTDPMVYYRDLLPESYTHQAVRGLNNWPQIIASGSPRVNNDNDNDEDGESYSNLSEPEDFAVLLINGTQRVPLAVLTSEPAISDHTHQRSMPVAINNQGTIIGWTDSGNSLYLLALDQDRDGDGMSNDWETYYGLDPDDHADATADADSDGKNNRAEFRLGTAPNTPSYRRALDTDADGLPDAWERKFFGHIAADLEGDDDFDGLSNSEEWVIGSNPLASDSDGDGLNDLEEFFLHGTDANNADTDGDGILDAQEIAGGSNPHDADSRPKYPPFLRMEVKEVTLVDDFGLHNKFYSRFFWNIHYPMKPELNGLFNYDLKENSNADFHPFETDYKPHKVIRLVAESTGTEEYRVPVFRITEVSEEEGAIPQVVTVQKEEFIIPAGQKVSNELATNAEVNGEDEYLLPVEVAPEVLAVNSDFDEGHIDPTTGYVIPDCDDIPNVDQKTGAGNTLMALEAVRTHLDGKFALTERITDDMHAGWFGVNPHLLDDEFWDGANVTIRKVEKIDTDTGYKESGQVLFYAKWGTGDFQYYGIEPYNMQTLAPVNLVQAGINGRPGESVYGSNSHIPGYSSFFIEGVRPGKITLEWRYQKGDVNIAYEQTFLVSTQKTSTQWTADLNYQIRLQAHALGADIHMEQYDPKNGFYLPNSQNYKYIQTVYYSYMQFYDQWKDKLFWAGMAKTAGASVYAGMVDMATWKTSVFVDNNDVDKVLIDFMIQGNKNIFIDMGWAHRAYVASGISALKYVRDEDDDTLTNFAAWIEIDQGIHSGNVAQLHSGNRLLLQREQRVIMPPLYAQMRQVYLNPGTRLEQLLATSVSGIQYPPRNAAGLINIDEMFSLNASNPVDYAYGPKLRALVPNGKLSIYDDRWAWIDNGGKGMIQIWLGTSTEVTGFTTAKRSTINSANLTRHAKIYSMLPTAGGFMDNQLPPPPW